MGRNQAGVCGGPACCGCQTHGQGRVDMPLSLLPRGCPRHKFVPVLTTGNSYEVVGPDGASVHIYPRDDLDFFRVSICLILLTKTVMAPE